MKFKCEAEHFDEVVSTPLPISANCQDGFLAAYWKRPEAYLKKGSAQLHIGNSQNG
ncbi:MAG: hypothetical protein RIF33_08640 [Cyclobacteriaceae bacterium]